MLDRVGFQASKWALRWLPDPLVLAITAHHTECAYGTAQYRLLSVLMALIWGNQWTNLVQPFWALPILGICKVPAGSILGYTLVLLLASQLCFLFPRPVL